MTAKKKTPAKRGRKPLPPEEKAEQLTVRLVPKMKFGLELLANTQKRSLSQVMDWAIRVGINSQHVGAGDSKLLLGDVLDEAWRFQKQSSRYLAVYAMAPQALSFEQEACCELITYSQESASGRSCMDFVECARLSAEKSPLPESLEVEVSNSEVRAKWRRTVIHLFSDAHWEKILEKAVDLRNQGKDLRGRVLLSVTGSEPKGKHPIEKNFVVMCELLGIEAPDWAHEDAKG